MGHVPQFAKVFDQVGYSGTSWDDMLPPSKRRRTDREL